MTWRCGPAIRSTRITRLTALPQAQAQMKQAGLQIGMVTGNFDLLTADHPLAEPLLAAMDSADVRLLKLGYFRFEPQTMDYWEQVENVRRAFRRLGKTGQYLQCQDLLSYALRLLYGPQRGGADASAARL